MISTRTNCFSSVFPIMFNTLCCKETNNDQTITPPIVRMSSVSSLLQAQTCVALYFAYRAIYFQCFQHLSTHHTEDCTIKLGDYIAIATVCGLERGEEG